MAYTDDWENLMNGVFGPGGKLRFDTQKTPPEKPGLPDMNAALLEQQKKLDEMLRKQNAELRRDTTQEALAQSRKMLEDMEADGLLAKGTTEVRQEHLGSFEGLAAEVTTRCSCCTTAFHCTYKFLAQTDGSWVLFPAYTGSFKFAIG